MDENIVLNCLHKLLCLKMIDDYLILELQLFFSLSQLKARLYDR